MRLLALASSMMTEVVGTLRDGSTAVSTCTQSTNTAKGTAHDAPAAGPAFPVKITRHAPTACTACGRVHSQDSSNGNSSSRVGASGLLSATLAHVSRTSGRVLQEPVLSASEAPTVAQVRSNPRDRPTQGPQLASRLCPPEASRPVGYWMAHMTIMRSAYPSALAKVGKGSDTALMT